MSITTVSLNKYANVLVWEKNQRLDTSDLEFKGSCGDYDSQQAVKNLPDEIFASEIPLNLKIRHRIICN